jgi:carbonic anhydrase/acetyltransferase-like protein (isoleucine patch superfamily)
VCFSFSFWAAKEQVEGMSKLRKQLDRFLLKKPKLGKGVYIARGAAVLGDVTLGDYSSVWYNAVLRGDINRIVVGHHTNVQDNAVLHLADDFPCVVGNYVTIGHSAVVHACTVRDEVLVGMGAIILDGAVIGRQSIIGAKALVTQGTKIPAGSLVLGAPAKVVRALTKQERAGVKYWAQKYVENSAYCLKNAEKISLVDHEKTTKARVGRSRLV